MSFRNILKNLGPGLLYAGAAIGVSHLVQSTRAGSDFGYSLIWAVIIANVLKYPFYEFGPRYAIATGKSLLSGYSSVGKWSVWLFFIMTLSTVFIIQAAVTIVTSGLAAYLFNIELPLWITASILLGICIVILTIGHYKLLDKIMKLIIVVLSITTIIALIFSFKLNTAKSIDFQQIFSFSNPEHVMFLIALMGWMPAPLDISVWHSIWTLEKNKERKQSLKESLLDFKIGFWGTLFLAICFLMLGANTIYGTGITLSSNAIEFSKQLIGVYTQSIGNWAFYVIGIAAFTTMFSTTLTCLDAFPRVLNLTTKELFGNKNEANDKGYWIWILITATGAVLVLSLFISNMKEMVDLATKISFLVAPVLAVLNYLSITNKNIPKSYQPSSFLKLLSLFGIVYLIGFSIYFLIYF